MGSGRWAGPRERGAARGSGRLAALASWAGINQARSSGRPCLGGKGPRVLRLLAASRVAPSPGNTFRAGAGNALALSVSGATVPNRGTPWGGLDALVFRECRS